jgi:hypothetical protein
MDTKELITNADFAVLYQDKVRLESPRGVQIGVIGMVELILFILKEQDLDEDSFNFRPDAKIDKAGVIQALKLLLPIIGITVVVLRVSDEEELRA